MATQLDRVIFHFWSFSLRFVESEQNITAFLKKVKQAYLRSNFKQRGKWVYFTDDRKGERRLKKIFQQDLDETECKIK